MALLCVPGMYLSKRVNPGSVFELAFLMGNIEEPAFILLDVQLHTYPSWTILKEHYPHVLYVITRFALVELERRGCIHLLPLSHYFTSCFSVWQPWYKFKDLHLFL